LTNDFYFIFIFFVVKIHHFTIEKKSQATWSTELFENFKEKSSPLVEVMKLPQFLEDLGIFLTFFFLKSSHLINGFYWFTEM
jgi:hypothetical protein